MRKMLHVSIVATMTGALLSGCSGNAAKQSDSTGQGSKAPVKFTISMSDTNTKYIQTSPDINQDKWVKKLGELTNTDIQFKMLPHQEFDQKVTLMLAGNDLPDVVNELQSRTPQSPQMGGSVQAGLFMPLDDLLKQYGPHLLQKIPQKAWDEVKYNGKIYAIPEFLSSPSRRGTIIRKDLLDKTGLPVPKTVDDYLNVFRAMKKNGVEQPFGFRENFIYADAFFGAYDVLPYNNMFELVNGKVQPKFFRAEDMEKALQVYKTMYDEGLMAKDFASVTSTIWNKNINSGKVAVWNHNANSMLNWQNTIKVNEPNAEVMLIPSPVGPDGKGGMGLYTSTVRLNYLNAKLDKAKSAAIIKFFDFMLTDEGEKFFNFGIEGDTYTMKDGKIVYQQPTTDQGKAEESFRSSNLHLVQDAAIDRTLLSLSDDGKKMLNQFDNVVSKEGRAGISFDPPLDANSKYPDVGLLFAQSPPLLLQHMLKMVYGKEPISNWPQVIEEWKAKGGNEILKEANDRYAKKSGVYIGPDSKVK